MCGTPVRVVECEGEPWFVAKDVCECLELTDVSKTISLLDDDEKGTNSIRTPGGEQQMLVVSEPGLYSLIFRSRKPETREFRRWVTHEVLPALRSRQAELGLKWREHDWALGLAAFDIRRRVVVP